MDCFDINGVENSRRRQLILFGVPGVIVLLLFLFGFGSLSIGICVSSLFLGAQLANWVVMDSNGYFLAPLMELWIGKENTTPRKHKKADVRKGKRRKLPWEDLFLPSSINEALEGFLEQIVEQYVNNWYEAGISRDRAFLNEIKYQIRYACANLVNRLQNVDLASVVAEEAIPAAALHAHRIIQTSATLNENVPNSLLESQISEKITDVHYCLGSRTNEILYLRQIADWLVPLLLDESRLSGRAHDDDNPNAREDIRKLKNWPSHSARHFLRELLVNAVLLPLADLTADPDTINQLIITAFDSQQIETEAKDHKTEVEFLRGLTDVSMDSVPDSLLQLKLSEILRDARQFSMFRLYLQDIQGPVNELNFLAESNRIHHSLQRKDESTSQISFDVWQLYSQFVHEGAPDKILFDDDTVAEFKRAIESKDPHELDRIIEKSYQIVYQRMQSNHVIPFCQSDAFLGYLCGSPPLSVTELIEKTSSQRRGSSAERTPSFNMFRTHLRRLFTLTSEGPEEGDETIVADEYPMTLKGKSEELDSHSGSSESDTGGFTKVDVPSIDISEDSSEPSPPIEEELPEAVLPSNEPVLVIDRETRNINHWKVAIPKVVHSRDSVTGRTVYGYIIEVHRNDAKPQETKQWSIFRRFQEFYVLEAKLLEFHGDALRLSNLPARKVSVGQYQILGIFKAFAPKTRAFVEQHRLVVASFLSSLCKQKVLGNSDLLLTFLSSPEEFRDNLMLSDLNPWRVVKKMPGRLTREKGQHLRPFLLNMLAKTLATPDKFDIRAQLDLKSETSSLSSVSAMGSEAPPSLYSRVFGNNFNKNVKIVDDSGYSTWTRSPTDAFLLLLTNFVPTASNWVFTLLSSLRLLCRSTFDNVVKTVVGKLFAKLLEEERLVYLVSLTEQSLFCSEAMVATEQEKSLREELAKRKVQEFVQDEIPSYLTRFLGRHNLRDGARRLGQSLQYPRLNKQLFYVLLDILLDNLFLASEPPFVDPLSADQLDLSSSS